MKVLDVKGLNCPLPILKAKKEIQTVGVGEKLQILATDPGSVKDFDAFCRQTGHKLVESGEQGGVYNFVIQRSS